jgi:hypothetical protein
LWVLARLALLDYQRAKRLPDVGMAVSCLLFGLLNRFAPEHELPQSPQFYDFVGRPKVHKDVERLACFVQLSLRMNLDGESIGVELGNDSVRPEYSMDKRERPIDPI